MADPAQSLVIPQRALFKAAEVCEIVHVQPYVLRTWEAEFPDLGVTKSAGAARVYRRADVERVARIKHLLLVEGLTLAGARRRLEEEAAPVAPEAPALDALLDQHARERLADVKRGLRAILELLSVGPGEADFRLAPPPPRATTPAARRAKPRPVKPTARGRSSPRRRRSA
jgi:DNA-binding transcriptional MerR regulator